MHHAKIDNYLIRESKLLISTKKLNKKSYFLQKDNISHRKSVPILLFIGVYQGMRFIDHGGKTTFLFAWWKFVPEKRTFESISFLLFLPFSPPLKTRYSCCQFLSSRHVIFFNYIP